MIFDVNRASKAPKLQRGAESVKINSGKKQQHEELTDFDFSSQSKKCSYNFHQTQL